MVSRIRTVVVLAILIVAVYAVSPRSQTISDKARNDDVVNVAKDDPDMAAAMRRARATLPEFLALAQAPRSGTSGYSVKVRVRDGGATEYFWIVPFTVKDGKFSGEINNRPRTVRNVAFGQTLAFAQDDIVDWLYRDGDKMKGSYTTCAILKHEPRREAAELVKRYGLECDF
jgi:uncharacterized protein YegJ (DUF2314 family)